MFRAQEGRPWAGRCQQRHHVCRTSAGRSRHRAAHLDKESGGEAGPWRRGAPPLLSSRSWCRVQELGASPWRAAGVSPVAAVMMKQ